MTARRRAHLEGDRVGVRYLDLSGVFVADEHRAAGAVGSVHVGVLVAGADAAEGTRVRRRSNSTGLS